jgi:LPXTG-motif cell wall-anchored protein
MPRSLVRVPLAGAAVCLTAALALAQSTQTTTEIKDFEVLAVEGNTLVVATADGAREVSVPSGTKFTVNGQGVALKDLKAGMTGTATLTRRTTTTPVTMTEVKNGMVVLVSGSNVYVRVGNDVELFTQTDIDRRGITLIRDGKPAHLAQFRQGDTLSATIVTSRPPKVVSEAELQAALTHRPEPAPTAPSAPAAAPSRPAAAVASAAPEAPPQPEHQVARSLPKTASSLPFIAVVGVSSLALAVALTVRRRRQTQY